MTLRRIAFALRSTVAVAFAAASSGSEPRSACDEMASADSGISATAISSSDGTGSPNTRRSVTLPGYCRVTGTLRPVPGSSIGYELWLPEQKAWTGRFLMVGNGGYSSAMPVARMAEAVARGSAVIATDTGHQGDDPNFARGHPESIVDWGWRAVHLTALEGKRLVKRFYGRPAAYNYFNGCSTGGHQAMMEAQRFPNDFEGIVAGAPGSDRVRLNASFLWQYLANRRADGKAGPILDRADLDLLERNSQRQCHVANGKSGGGLASDDWLNDPLSCHPDPTVLACGSGQTTACLSSVKINAAKAMYAGASNTGSARHHTFPWLPGSERGWHVYWADPSNPDQPMRVNFWREWAFGRSWTWSASLFGEDLRAAQAKLSAVIDATDPDLRAFRAHGGKLLQYHGLADPVVSPLNTLDYRRAMLRRSGPAGDWYRLFLVPGMGHCAGGKGFTLFDTQQAIETWVERRAAPATLVAQSTDGASRPLCAFPDKARFVRGDPTHAASFKCKP